MRFSRQINDVPNKHISVALAFAYIALAAYFSLRLSKAVAYLSSEVDYRLPTLTEFLLPLVGYTPIFLVGIVPAIVVAISKDPQSKPSERLTAGSAIILTVFVCWVAVLAFGLDYIFARLSRVL